MRVLVSGGGGFIGSHVAEYYAKGGNEVVVLDNLSRAKILGANRKTAFYNWSYLKNYRNIKLIEGDVRSLKEVEEAVKDVDVIIHAAAQVAVTTSVKDPKLDFEVNALGTLNILEAARKAKKSPAVIYCSTNKVYGANVNKVLVKEEETRYIYADERYRDGIPEDFPIDLCEHTPYGCSKLAGDLYVQDYAYTYGLKTAVFRMSCVYGERQFGTEDQGWVAWFIIATLLNKPIKIYGDGKQVRDILYVSDLIEAYEKFLNSGLKQEVFNIGGGVENSLSLLELLNLLKELTGKRAKTTFNNWRAGDQKIYISNISKAKEKLGWRPKINPREGVERLVKWVKNNESIWLSTDC